MCRKPNMRWGAQTCCARRLRQPGLWTSVWCFLLKTTGWIPWSPIICFDPLSACTMIRRQAHIINLNRIWGVRRHAAPPYQPRYVYGAVEQQQMLRYLCTCVAQHTTVQYHREYRGCRPIFRSCQFLLSYEDRHIHVINQNICVHLLEVLYPYTNDVFWRYWSPTADVPVTWYRAQNDTINTVVTRRIFGWSLASLRNVCADDTMADTFTYTQHKEDMRCC